MKIECPRCGEQVEYSPGAVQVCPFCKVSLRLPEVNQLPEHLRSQWFKEQAAAKAREEKQRKKLEAEQLRRQASAKKAAEEAVRLEKERAEQQRRQEEERIQAEHNARRRAAAKAREIPEQKLVDHYPGLETVKSVFNAIMVVCFMGAGIAGVVALAMFAEEKTAALAPLLLGFAIGLAGMALWYWCVAELLELAINLARDAKITRELLTRMVHPDKMD